MRAEQYSRAFKIDIRQCLVARATLWAERFTPERSDSRSGATVDKFLSQVGEPDKMRSTRW